MIRQKPLGIKDSETEFSTNLQSPGEKLRCRKNLYWDDISVLQLI